MWRCLPVVLLGCSFQHGAASDLPPGDGSNGGGSDAPRDAKVWLDGKVFDDAPASSGIMFVQGNSFGPGVNSATVSAAYTAAQHAHDLNVVVINWNGAAATVTSVTDDTGSTYRRIGTAVTQGANVLDTFYAADIAGTGLANVVTASFDAVVATPEMRILEYSGIAMTSPTDGFNQGQANNSTGVATGAINTTHGYDLIVGCEASTDSVKTLGSGYTLRVDAAGDQVADKIVSTTGSYDFTATLNNNATWEARVMAFKGL